MCRKLVCLGFLVLLLTLVAEAAIAADYYIDPVNGSDDTGNGSLANPWKSFENIIKYYKSSYRPSGWVDFQPGDTIYLMDGVYSQIVHPGDGSGTDGGGSYIVYFRTKHGDSENQFHIRPYPGHHPIIDPQYNGIGIYVLQSSWWQIEGLEVRNAYGRGILIAETDRVKIHNVHIYDTDGVDNNNIAGLYISSSTNVEVYDSIFNDNYDRTCADTGGKATENSCNAVIFSGAQGGDVTIHDCNFYQSLPLSDDKSGAGLKYKHASRDPDAFFHVYNNIFTNHKFFAFGSGTANTHFHHNIINGGGSISSRDFGGTTHQVNQLFEYNTIYDSTGFGMSPTTGWRNEQFPDDPKNITYRNNIVYDTSTSYSQERATVGIGTYMSDELYYIVVPELHFGKNCYYNPNRAVQFNIAAGFNYKPDYAEGGQYSLGQWQTTYGYDLNSLETAPLFVDPNSGDFRLQTCSPCANMGRYAGDLDGDGVIGWGDVKVICDHWLQTGPAVEGDLNNDQTVNFPDFAEFALVWQVQ